MGYPTKDDVRQINEDAMIIQDVSPEAVFASQEAHSLYIKTTAQLIADGNIVAWFWGRWEAGPRALGNRSLLADPRNSSHKDHLNQNVKHRHEFRPYAPSVLEENAAEWFYMNGYASSPYMSNAFKVREEKVDIIPAVLHIDNTTRPQTVTREQNPMYYDLIVAFYKLTGVPMILNTSFNDAGMPIVASPDEALQCLKSMEIDFLALQGTIFKKKR